MPSFSPDVLTSGVPSDSSRLPQFTHLSKLVIPDCQITLCQQLFLSIWLSVHLFFPTLHFIFMPHTHIKPLPHQSPQTLLFLSANPMKASQIFTPFPPRYSCLLSWTLWQQYLWTHNKTTCTASSSASLFRTVSASHKHSSPLHPIISVIAAYTLTFLLTLMSPSALHDSIYIVAFPWSLSLPLISLTGL